MTIAHRLRDWGRDHPQLIDVGIVLALLAFALDPMLSAPKPGERDPDLFAFVLFFLSIVPVVWRRSHPVPVLVVCATTAVIYEALSYPDSALNALSALLAIYAVAAYGDRRQAISGGAFAAIAIGFIMWANWDAEANLGNILANYVIFGTAWVAGDNIRQRRERVQALEERAALAESSKEEAALRAVAAERTRIARELHDVVAHSVSVMVVQAGAARRLLQKDDPDPERAVEALASVESTGRESLTELRRLLGVLRQDDDRSFGRVPQPSIAHVDSLVQHAREAGLLVSLEVEGKTVALAPGVDLTAYRIVQEALTNAIKHAGPGVRADVRVCYAGDVLEVVVADDGRGIDADRANGGHGLVGMEERVALFGGTLDVGNRAGGGVQVRATLPLETV